MMEIWFREDRKESRFEPVERVICIRLLIHKLFTYIVNCKCYIVYKILAYIWVDVLMNCIINAMRIKNNIKITLSIIFVHGAWRTYEIYTHHIVGSSSYRLSIDNIVKIIYLFCFCFFLLFHRFQLTDDVLSFEFCVCAFSSSTLCFNT